MTITLSAGATDDGGRLSVDVPEGATGLRFEAEHDGRDGEVRFEIGADAGDLGEPADEAAEDGLRLGLEGPVQPGGTATLVVTDADGNPVGGAEVSVRIELSAGTTGQDGRLSIDVPAGIRQLRVRASSGDQEGEVKVRFTGNGKPSEDRERERPARGGGPPEGGGQGQGGSG